MRKSCTLVGTLMAAILLFASTAYPWGFAAHAYLAVLLNKELGDRNLNEMYGGTTPDMFNLRFDLPVYGEGEIYFQLHYLWENVWDQQKTGMEKALGFGFVSHNDHGGADSTAQHARITYGTKEGYVIAKAQDLLIEDPSLLDFVDEATAHELARTFVEFALEVLTARLDPAIGEKIITGAALRDARFPSMLADAFAESFAPLFGNDPVLAAQVIVTQEEQFRQKMIGYGQMMTLDEGTLVCVPAEDRLVRMAYELEPVDREKLLDALGQLGEGGTSAEASPASGAQALFVGDQRLDASKAQPLGEPLVDPLCGRIESGVGAIDRNPGGDQVQQHSARRPVGGQPLQRAKRQGVMGNNQVRESFHRFGGGGRCDGQAGHQPAHGATAIAHQQPDVIPLFRQALRGEPFQELHHRFDGRHGHKPGRYPRRKRANATLIIARLDASTFASVCRSR